MNDIAIGSALTLADSQTATIYSTIGDVPIRAYPPEIPLFGRVRRTYCFIRPVVLTVERDEDGSYVVSDYLFGIYGHAFNLNDAVRDYISAFAGYYELLSEHQDAPTVALFQELKRYFQPIR